MNFEDIKTRKRNLQSINNSMNDSVQSKQVEKCLSASPDGDVIQVHPLAVAFGG